MIVFPKTTLTGQLVTLRPLVRGDASAMFASLAEPEVTRLTETHSSHSLEDVEAHCARIEDAEDRVDFGILVDGELIGEAALHDLDRINRHACFRIAIWYPQDRNRGFGSEATRLVVQYGFKTAGLNRIELEVYAFNPRARRVYEKAGFVFEGTRRQVLIWDGKTVDGHIMAMLRTDYHR